MGSFAPLRTMAWGITENPPSSQRGLLLMPAAEWIKPIKPAADTLLTVAALSALVTSLLGMMLASNDGFSGQQTVLGPPERENVHAGIGGEGSQGNR